MNFAHLTNMVKDTFRSRLVSTTMRCLAVAFLTTFQARSSDPLPPTITTQPQSQVITSGTSVAFSVIASGTGPLSYLWQWNGTNILNATNDDTFSISNTLPSQAGSYQVIVTDGGLSVTSIVASLTVLAPPGLTNAPQVYAPILFPDGWYLWRPSSSVVMGNSDVMIVVNPSGTAPLFYQWQLNGTNIDGATERFYMLYNIWTNQAGAYQVVVSNAVGSVTSAVTTLVVRAPMRILNNHEDLWLTSGDFGLRVADFRQPLMFLVMEASSNLVNWFGIYTNRSPATFQTFVDSDASNYPHRFYRAVGRDSLFKFGVTAKVEIDLNGNNLRTDSFDSSDSGASTAGRYDSTKARAHGDVAAYLGVANSVNVGGVDIHGNVTTGPQGSVNIGSQGMITGTITDDMKVPFPDVTVPFASGGYLTSPSRINTNTNGTTYAGIFDSGNYRIDNLPGTSKILFTGQVSIWMPNGFNQTGSGRIDLAVGARVTIYTGATSSISGGGIINNGDPSQLIVYGLPGCTSLSFGGNGSFTGCVYAPNAAFSARSANNTYDFAGAIVTKTVTLNSHLNFHYDENLQSVGPLR